MILVDPSIWIDHFRSPDPVLVDLLRRGKAATHPLIIGELAMGSLHDRGQTLALLVGLPSIGAVPDDDVLALIERETLFGTGLSFVDAHLLAAALVNRDLALWTRDKRLRLIADRLGRSAPPPPLH